MDTTGDPGQDHEHDFFLVSSWNRDQSITEVIS